MREQIQSILEVIEVEKHERYLGLPTMVGRSKKVIFNHVRERVWKKLNSWKRGHLSRAGKEVLIKSVLQAIPTYTMSCFYLTAGLCRDIEQMLCKFWWGDIDKDKIHWMNWKKLCVPKCEGGMGFRDLEAFNLALLARQGWRIIQEPSSLLARLFKARYFPSSSFLDAKVGFNPSYTWRSVLKGREFLQLGCYWQVGNGTDIHVMKDRWIPRPSSFRPITSPNSFNAETRVIELIDWSTKEWRLDILEEHFAMHDVEVIRDIHLINHEMKDSLVWHYEKSGNFSVKSCYKIIMDRKRLEEGRGEMSDATSTNKFWKTVWNVNTVPRTKAFLWQCANGALPCKSNLFRRKQQKDPFCNECGGVETELHVLLMCPRAKIVWRMLPDLKECGKVVSSFQEWLERVSEGGDDQRAGIWAAVTHGIWLARNNRIFQGLIKEPEEVVESQIRAQSEFQRIAQLSKKRKEGAAQTSERWKRPPLNFLKINCDAAASPAGCGIGFIGRNDKGEAVIMGSKRIQDGTPPDVAEAEAVLWAVECAIDNDFQAVIFESDSLIVTHALQKRKVERNVLGATVRAILDKARGLSLHDWSHARRTGNKAAHCLAQLRPLSSVISFNSLPFGFAIDKIILEDLE